MTNIKDLIQSNSVNLDQYQKLDNQILEGWTIDYNILKQSQFLVYISLDHYIELIQVGKNSITKSKRLMINDPIHSSVFSQMTEDLQLVEGELISQEINQLTRQHKIKVNIEKSNDNNLSITILEGDEENNESDSEWTCRSRSCGK